MDATATKHLSDALRQLNAHVKRCRAADQILQGYLRLNSNSSSDGVARALGELQSAADEPGPPLAAICQGGKRLGCHGHQHVTRRRGGRALIDPLVRSTQVDKWLDKWRW